MGLIRPFLNDVSESTYLSSRGRAFHATGANNVILCEQLQCTKSTHVYGSIVCMYKLVDTWLSDQKMHSGVSDIYTHCVCVHVRVSHSVCLGEDYIYTSRGIEHLVVILVSITITIGL